MTTKHLQLAHLTAVLALAGCGGSATDTPEAAATAAPTAVPVASVVQACARACLEDFVDRYFDAVSANDPAQLPLASDVIFTEDGQRLLIGDGLWNTMKNKGAYRLFVTDVPAGQVTFLAFAAEEPLRRYFVSSAVVLGFLTHLVLDEIWSVQLGMFGPKFKKSFGTALKFHGPTMWPNVLTYVLTAILGALVAGDAAWTEKLATAKQQMEQATRTFQQYSPQQWQYRR